MSHSLKAILDIYNVVSNSGNNNPSKHDVLTIALGHGRCGDAAQYEVQVGRAGVIHGYCDVHRQIKDDTRNYPHKLTMCFRR